MLKNFWCENVVTAAKACLENTPEDAKRSISIADDVCENRFVFRDHWEMERTNQPVDFGEKVSDIDWGHIPGDDPEWLYAMNRHTSFVNLGKAWLYTGTDKYAQKYAELISDWIDRVPLTEESSQNTWRSLEAGLRCEFWLRAMKMFENCSVMTSELKSKIENSLLVHGDYLVKKYTDFHKLSNWGVLQDHGLFLLGVYFDNAEWKDLALKRLDLNLHRSIMRDGSQWEQSPMYHCEVLHTAIDVLLIARQNNIAVPKRYEENLLKMSHALASWMTPDGRLLCQSDSDNVDARDMVLIGAILFKDSRLRTVAGDKMFEESYWDFGPEKEAEYLAIPTVAQELTSTALPDSGNYLLRSSGSSDSGYLHFHCGCMGSGHGHADQLHIDAGIGGEDVLIDSGRYTYVDCEMRKILKQPAAHNTTRVDNADFTAYIDTWAYGKMAIPIKNEYTFTDTADLVSGIHLGYLDKGVIAGRKVIYLKELNVALICDRFYTKDDQPHSYEANFHFNEGECSLHQNVVHWKGKQAQAVLMGLSDGEYVLKKAPYSRDYNNLQQADVLTITTQQKGFATMIHLLSMDCDGKDHGIMATKVAVSKLISKEILKNEQAEAIKIRKDDKEMVVILCHNEIISAVDMIEAEGYYGYGKTLVFSQHQPEGICLEW